MATKSRSWHVTLPGRWLCPTCRSGMDTRQTAPTLDACISPILRSLLDRVVGQCFSPMSLSGSDPWQGATMDSQNAEFRKVASLADIPLGGTKAVRPDDKRSVALFNVDGRIYATTNQCPHMGYPLTRGTVRYGVVTCDWHRRSFDLEGGGCFMPGCDDLETFPVEVRNGDVWIRLGNPAYTRKDKHLRLLWEGLLRSDEWTIAKAIGQLQAGGVPDTEIAHV